MTGSRELDVYLLNQQTNLLGNVWRSMGPEGLCSGGCVHESKAR